MCSAERNYNAVAVRTFFEVFSFHNNDVFCLHLKVDVELNLRPKDQLGPIVTKNILAGI